MLPGLKCWATRLFGSHNGVRMRFCMLTFYSLIKYRLGQSSLARIIHMIWQMIFRLFLALYVSYIDGPFTQDIAGVPRTNSSVMYSYGPPHMAKQKEDDQLEHTYSSYVRIRDVALKTCQRRWMIWRSGERGSGISVLAAQHKDDDDVDIYTYIIYNSVRMKKKRINN